MDAKAAFDVLSDDQQRLVFQAANVAYDSNVDAILNGLQEMAARIAIAAGVEPERFAAGMKHHWDRLADAVNVAAKKLEN